MKKQVQMYRYFVLYNFLLSESLSSPNFGLERSDSSPDLSRVFTWRGKRLGLAPTRLTTTPIHLPLNAYMFGFIRFSVYHVIEYFPLLTNY
jgi:hypothetical protein